MKEKTDELKKKFNTDFVCPENVTKGVAWRDQTKPEDKRIGLMHCFCIDTAKKLPTKFLNTNFTEFKNDEYPKGDPNKYCKTWAINYALQKSMVIGTAMVVTVINILTNTIFEKIVFVEKKHTINDETAG
jgi:hypothetical protein